MEILVVLLLCAMLVAVLVWIIVCVREAVRRHWERMAILQAARRWAERHPDPKKTCLMFGTIALAPEDIPLQLTQNTEASRVLWGMINLARNNGGDIDGILVAFGRR